MIYCKNIRYVVPVTVTLSIQLCSEDRDYSTSTKKSVFLLDSGLKCIFPSSVLPCWKENTPHIGSCFRNCYTLQSYGIKGWNTFLATSLFSRPGVKPFQRGLSWPRICRRASSGGSWSESNTRAMTVGDFSHIKPLLLSYCEKLTVKADVICAVGIPCSVNIKRSNEITIPQHWSHLGY